MRAFPGDVTGTIQLIPPPHGTGTEWRCVVRSPIQVGRARGSTRFTRVSPPGKSPFCAPSSGCVAQAIGCLKSERGTAIRSSDYLPVEDADGHLIGLLANHAIGNASRDGDDARVGDHIDPLSEADLIGAGTPIAALIGRIRQKPFLVVSGQEIIGMVAWSDLQKLPVRAALFALVTGFELTMYETIKRQFGERDDWTDHLDECRLCMAKKEYRDQRERDSDVDLLLCTQFCDKRDILIESFDFAIGKRKLEKKFRAIERVRNDVAHANNYAMTFEQAKKLRTTLGDLGELRRHINLLAR